MSILCSARDAVSSGSWLVVFKFLTLKVAILTIYDKLSGHSNKPVPLSSSSVEERC